MKNQTRELQELSATIASKYQRITGHVAPRGTTLPAMINAVLAAEDGRKVKGGRPRRARRTA